MGLGGGGARTAGPTPAAAGRAAFSAGAGRCSSGCGSGVCRTDLHLAEGDLPVRRASTVPGHEVVSEVTGLGPGAHRFAAGDRVGIAWLRHTCGTCRWCRSGRENLCRAVAVHRSGTLTAATPSSPSCQRDSPTGCRTRSRTSRLRRCCARASSATTRSCAAQLPAGGRLGIYGFGASAHLTAQVAIAQGAGVRHDPWRPGT